MALIYEITHKKAWMHQGKGYQPLWVGAYNKDVTQGYVRDDSGDNISKKNDAYCELTGLYWIWKNSNEEKVGLVHYRRFFGEYFCKFKIRSHYLVLNKKKSYRIFSIDELIQMLGSKDLLVKETVTEQSTLDCFLNQIGKSICDDVADVLKTRYPSYLDTFLVEMNGNTHFSCNMFFGKKDIMDQYCQWLFTILSALEEKQMERTSDTYHNRELGYVGEMLFKVWIKHNKIDYRVVNAISFEEICNPLEYTVLTLNAFKLWRKNVRNKKEMHKRY